jgi:hypothetical protein
MNGHRADHVILDEADTLRPPDHWKPAAYVDYVGAITIADGRRMIGLPHKCRRCDYKNGELEHQCNECAAYEQRHAFCLCGHTVPMHHNGMGCLATMAGELCDCTELDLTPQPRPEEMIA